jgi:hypothetical protein
VESRIRVVVMGPPRDGGLSLIEGGQVRPLRGLQVRLLRGLQGGRRSAAFSVLD